MLSYTMPYNTIPKVRHGCVSWSLRSNIGFTGRQTNDVVPVHVPHGIIVARIAVQYHSAAVRVGCKELMCVTQVLCNKYVYLMRFI